jgi:cob(I)alamin adenosyltransferase
MKITTKRGDTGKTDLFGGQRLPKSHFVIEIIGQLDHLQAVIGLFKTKIKKRQLLAELTAIQSFLYSTMAHLANAKALSSQEYSVKLREIETWQECWIKKKKIKNKFVIPGNNQAEAWANLCRTQTRLVEQLLSKHKQKKLIPYYNRLSDYFFVVSQFLLS